MISFTALSKLSSQTPVAIPRNSITTPFTHPSTLALGQVLIASLFKVAAASQWLSHPSASPFSTLMPERFPKHNSANVSLLHNKSYPLLSAGKVPQNLTLPSFPAWSSSLFQLPPGIGVPGTRTSSSVSQNHQFLSFIQYSDFSLECQTSPPPWSHNPNVTTSEKPSSLPQGECHGTLDLPPSRACCFLYHSRGSLPPPPPH